MHLQRNAYQNYILLLTNNFKFYILQILGHLKFLSVFFVFAKNKFANLITRRLQPLVLQFREKHQDATARKGLKPLVIKKLIATPHAVCRWHAHCVNNSEKSTQGVTTPCYSDFAFSGALKNQFASLNNNVADAHCVNNSEKSTQGVKTPCYSDFASNFEIISRNENYAFNHNKNFCRNGNNIFLRNDYGGNFIFDFWSNFNFGFLFNRKINSKNILFQKEKKR